MCGACGRDPPLFFFPGQIFAPEIFKLSIFYTKFLAISKAKTKKQPKAKTNPVVGIVGIKAMPIAEHKASITHLIIYNILFYPFLKNVKCY